MLPPATRFRASFCHPFEPSVRELGELTAAEVLAFFQQVPWRELLSRIDAADPATVYYSPSFEVTHEATQNGLCLSAVGGTAEFEYYLFYRRPKNVKTFFGLRRHFEPQYTTEVLGQNLQNALDCLQALLRHDQTYLERHIG